MIKIPASVISNSIKRGDILLSEFKGIEHQKFFVIMGVSKNKVCGFFFINSNIHPRVFSNQELLDMQYPLKKSDYPFLKYNSFLNASNVLEMDLETISNRISEKTATIVNRLKDEHIKDILGMVLKSKAISEMHKNLYFR